LLADFSDADVERGLARLQALGAVARSHVTAGGTQRGFEFTKVRSNARGKMGEREEGATFTYALLSLSCEGCEGAGLTVRGGAAGGDSRLCSTA